MKAPPEPYGPRTRERQRGQDAWDRFTSSDEDIDRMTGETINLPAVRRVPKIVGVRAGVQHHPAADAHVNAVVRGRGSVHQADMVQREQDERLAQAMALGDVETQMRATTLNERSHDVNKAGAVRRENAAAVQAMLQRDHQQAEQAAIMESIQQRQERAGMTEKNGLQLRNCVAQSCRNTFWCVPESDSLTCCARCKNRYMSQEAVRETALTSLEADAAYEHGRSAGDLKTQQTADAAYKGAIKRNRDCAAGPEYAWLYRSISFKKVECYENLIRFAPSYTRTNSLKKNRWPP